MARVLKARFELVYQLGLLKQELCEVMHNSPPIEVSDDNSKRADGTAGHSKIRKAVDGDCPICFTAFDNGSSSNSGGGEDLVFCRAQCGQNLHKECFEMWARTKRGSHARDSAVTCPMCRTPWQGDEPVISRIKESGTLTGEGYLNVADQLGISRHRGQWHHVSELTISSRGFLV